MQSTKTEELVITMDNFKKEVLESTKPVLVDFWASWCGPCRMQLPILGQVAQTVGDRAVVGKINVDEQPELAQMFGVMSIPTLIVFENGKVADRTMGVTPKDRLIKMLNLK
jgi:thioredoxin 1